MFMDLPAPHPLPGFCFLCPGENTWTRMVAQRVQALYEINITYCTREVKLTWVQWDT